MEQNSSVGRAYEDRWRDCYQVVGGDEQVPDVSRGQLDFRVSGHWWEALEATRSTLLVSREYEHFLVALSVDRGTPRNSYMPVPHPTGITYDVQQETVYIASTRNPNYLLELAPLSRMLNRGDCEIPDLKARPLIPRRLTFLPGALYVHDISMIGQELYLCATGENVVLKFDDAGVHRTWWPKCIEKGGKPDVQRNYIQLNSIASGPTIEDSFFSASSDHISARRPGHLNYPVDGKGVIFSGATREVVADGLTRPHSARVHRHNVWVNNSGYGEFGFVEDGSFSTVTRLPGWTRGLAFAEELALVATSPVIPRFRHYAPGVDPDRAKCAIYAIDLQKGSIVGKIEWAQGSQIFGLQLIPRDVSLGFPATRGVELSKKIKNIFYAFDPNFGKD